ncbi:MAG: hypothetical protein HY444_06900 [Nitrospirae bacterium]|nr:hypothetical protein [Nitrospirota bacterium]
MGMQSTTSNAPRLLAATVMAALFSCQVIGSMCMMMPPAADASAAIRGAHVAHVMGEVGMCHDSIPSSQKSKEASDSSLLPWPESSSVSLTPIGTPPMQSSARLLQTSDPPLYARLSTFRI